MSTQIKIKELAEDLVADLPVQGGCLYIVSTGSNFEAPCWRHITSCSTTSSSSFRWDWRPGLLPRTPASPVCARWRPNALLLLSPAAPGLGLQHPRLQRARLQAPQQHRARCCPPAGGCLCFTQLVQRVGTCLTCATLAPTAGVTLCVSVNQSTKKSIVTTTTTTMSTAFFKGSRFYLVFVRNPQGNSCFWIKTTGPGLKNQYNIGCFF